MQGEKTALYHHMVKTRDENWRWHNISDEIQDSSEQSSDEAKPTGMPKPDTVIWSRSPPIIAAILWNRRLAVIPSFPAIVTTASDPRLSTVSKRTSQGNSHKGLQARLANRVTNRH
jgi:hypothetical protein